jgi:hypothetical protein
MIIIGFGFLVFVLVVFMLFSGTKKAVKSYGEETEKALKNEFKKDISQRHW